ncbi:MAG: hypothetical protein IPM85_00005 [Chitinophagaceae bacterium]|nr:hypothetical protein [Chitinophagaceae bacterium]
MIASLAALKNKYKADPVKLALTDSLERYAKIRIDFSDRMIAERKAHGLNASAGIVASGLGTIPENIRQLVIRLETTERGVLRQLNEKRQSFIELLNKLLLVIMLLILVFVSVVLARTWRELIVRKKTQVILQDFNTRLQEEVDRQIKERFLVF